MGKEIVFKLKPGTELSAEEIAMIEAARNLPVVDDEDNPEIVPGASPAQYNALMQAVARRNQHLRRAQRQPG